jgi:hypothetical protein
MSVPSIAVSIILRASCQSLSLAEARIFNSGRLNSLYSAAQCIFSSGDVSLCVNANS